MTIAEQVYMEAMKQSKERNYSMEEALADKASSLLYELDCVAISIGARKTLTSSAFKTRFLAQIANFFDD